MGDNYENAVKWYLSGFTANFTEKLREMLMLKLRLGANSATIKKGLKAFVSEIFDDTPDAEELKDYKKRIVSKTVEFLNSRIDKMAKQVGKRASRTQSAIRRSFYSQGRTFRVGRSLKTAKATPVANVEMGSPPPKRASAFNMSDLKSMLNAL